MDRYDEMNKKFMNKAHLVGANVKTTKLPSGPYRLEYYQTNGDILVIPPFISQIDFSALRVSNNLKKIVLPSTITSFRSEIPHSLEHINIPEKVEGIHWCFNGSYNLTMDLVGCKKSVQSNSLASAEKLKINNSQLIGRIWKNGLFRSEVAELRLIKTRLDNLAINESFIEKLFLSTYTQTEMASIHNSTIDTLYYFVSSQQEAMQFMQDLQAGSWKISMLSRCSINHVIPVVKDNLAEIIEKI